MEADVAVGIVIITLIEFVAAFLGILMLILAFVDEDKNCRKCRYVYPIQDTPGHFRCPKCGHKFFSWRNCLKI